MPERSGAIPSTQMNLQPVDFKAVAAKGCFVYCYLREHDLTPYYIGIASRSSRPLDPHSCKLPAYNALIRCMRTGLSRESAIEWERFYIARYGQSNRGGLLRNMTDGGDGAFGRPASELCIKELIARNQSKVWDEEAKEKVSRVHKGKAISQKHREACRRRFLGTKRPEVGRPCPERKKAYLRALFVGKKAHPNTVDSLRRINHERSVNGMPKYKGGGNPNSKSWIITDPSGEVFHLDNMSDFCREHGLNQAHLSAVAKGTRKHHKRYTAMAA